MRLDLGVSPPHESTQVTPPSTEQQAGATLRFPQISLISWYRAAGLAHRRGLLPARKLRLARFLSQQELDPATGRVVGQWGTGRVDGGMTLAARYAWQHGIGEDRFWDDLKGLYRFGFAERVVAPAPGRRAVYALVLRTDAIVNDLPDDLAQQLRTWDLPEAEYPDEDVHYGRLAHAIEHAEPPDPAVIAVDERAAASLAVAPRWEHPAGSSAANVAEDIRASATPLGVEAGPNPRCWAVAERDRAEALTERLMANGKASPLYAKGSSLSGLFSTGSRELIWSKKMEKHKTTPSATPTRSPQLPSGDDPQAVAARVLRRAWHSWRRELGRSKVLLPSQARQPLETAHSGSAWSDLQRTIVIALRRSSEAELVELLTSSVDGVDDMGKLAGWRLWRLINARPDAHGYGRRHHVPQAEHVTAWDEATAAERDRVRTQVAQARARHRQQQEARRSASAERAATYRRWGLTIPQMREPEQVHQAATEEPDRSPDAIRAAALERAKREKRERRRGT